MKEKPVSPAPSEKSHAPIDMSRFKELSDGDHDSLIELLQLYLSKTREQVLELAQSIESGDTAVAARLAHSLVGANAMVGMVDIVPLLRTLEEQAEKHDLSRARITFTAIQHEFERIQSGLKEHVQLLSRP